MSALYINQNPNDPDPKDPNNPGPHNPNDPAQKNPDQSDKINGNLRIPGQDDEVDLPDQGDEVEIPDRPQQRPDDNVNLPNNGNRDVNIPDDPEGRQGDMSDPIPGPTSEGGQGI